MGDFIQSRDEPDGVSWIYLSPDSQKGNIAHVRIWQRDDGELWLTDIDVPTHLQRAGRGRILVDLIRRFAEANEMTTYTYGATPDADDFYVAVGCVWQPDREEFLVWPVSGERIDGQMIYRAGYDD